VKYSIYKNIEILKIYKYGIVFCDGNFVVNNNQLLFVMTEFCHKNIYYLFSTNKCRHKYNIDGDNSVVENYFINDEIFPLEIRF
jgi:hypothetical protein